MYNRIIDNIYVGDLNDAKNFSGHEVNSSIVCVLEFRPQDEPEEAYHIPILTRSGHVYGNQLMHLAGFIEYLKKTSDKVLIHCMAGMERSPLTVAYYISYSKGISLEEAYKIVKKNRPQTMDRSIWLK